MKKKGALKITVKNTRLAMRAKYRHTISGRIHGDIPGFTLGKDHADPWMIEYTMCFMDTDALACLVDGVLLIPAEPC